MCHPRYSIVSLLSAAVLLVAGPVLGQSCLDYSDFYPHLAPIGPLFHGPGDVQHVVAADNLLCLATDTCIQVFDVTDPDNPRYLADVDLLADCLVLHGDYLYTARKSGRLEVVDLANPETPQVLTGNPLPEGGMDLAIQDDFLYIALGMNHFGLAVFDLKDPWQPKRRGWVYGPLGFSICVSGTRAYLVQPSMDDDFSFVIAVDIESPQQPAELYINGVAGRALCADIVDEVLFIPTNTHGLQYFDVSSPDRIVRLGVLIESLGTYQIVLAPPYGYGTCFGESFQCAFSLDVSDPRAPSYIGWETMENKSRDIAHADGWVYLATDEEIPDLLNVQNPTTPTLHDWNGSTPLVPINASGVAGAGELAYVGNYEGDPLLIFDLSDPAAPTKVGSVAGDDHGSQVAVRGDLLFQVVNPIDPVPENRLLVYSLEQANAPLLIGSLDFESTIRHLTAGPGAVYLPYYGTIHIVDTSDPTTPSYAGGVEPPSDRWVNHVAVADGVAYCSMGSDGIFIYDVTVPTEMVMLESIDCGYVIEVQVQGDLAVATSQTEYFVTLDVSDPSNPEILAEMTTPDSNWHVTLDGPLAYISGYDGQLWVYDLQDPRNPVLVGQTQLSTFGSAYDLVGPWIVSAMGAQGLGLAWRACQITGVPGLLPSGRLALSAYPNPFNPAVNVSFSLEQEATISLDVHDLAGRNLGTLAAGHYQEGNHHLTWRGLGSNGGSLASGTYLLRLDAEGQIMTKKVTLVR